MNIIEAVKLMKENHEICIIKEGWKEKGSTYYNYYLVYNQYFECFELIDIMETYRLNSSHNDYAYAYEFSIDDILRNDWKIYKD